MHKIKLLISCFLMFTIIFSFMLPSLAEDSTYVWSPSTVSTNSSETEPISNNLNLESPSAVLIEQTTGQVLYEHNSHEQLRPASVTKVMSILLIMEAINER